LSHPIVLIPRHRARHMVRPDGLIKAPIVIIDIGRSVALRIGDARLQPEYVPGEAGRVTEPIRCGDLAAQGVILVRGALAFGIGLGNGLANPIIGGLRRVTKRIGGFYQPVAVVVCRESRQVVGIGDGRLVAIGVKSVGRDLAKRIADRNAAAGGIEGGCGRFAKAIRHRRRAMVYAGHCGRSCSKIRCVDARTARAMWPATRGAKRLSGVAHQTS